jgi:putative peptidoglycan lipid II flippase
MEKLGEVSKQLKNIGFVAGLTVISRVLGLVRDQLSAAVFGASLLNSAFVTAFRLPNLFRRLLGEGSLVAAFVPTLQHSLQKDGEAAAFRLINQVASWLLVVSGVLVGIGMLLSSQSRLLEGQEQRWYLSADLTVILFPYLIFVCLAAVFSAALNVMNRFGAGAISPVLLNITMIVSLAGAGLHWADTPMGQLHWLCAGVLVGGVLQLALPMCDLARSGWRPAFDLSLSPGVREIALLMLPGLWGAAIYQINLFVSQYFALLIDDSAASLFFYANRLTELPIGIFAIAISTVVYPLIARHAAAGDMAEMGRDYLKGIRLILVVNIPAAVGLALLAEPIIRVLFERGAFKAADTQSLTGMLILSVLGLPFFAVVSLTTRAFYAVKDTRTPVRIATVSFVVNVLSTLLFMRLFKAQGLMLASSLSVIIQCLMLQRALARKVPGLEISRLGADIGKISAAALVMGLLVAGTWWGLLRGHGRSADWLALLVLIPVAAGLYGLVLYLLRIGGREEFEVLLAKLTKKREARSE